MLIKILCVSDSDKHFSPAAEEYQKRLGSDCKIKTIKPEKGGAVHDIVKKETDRVLAFLEKYQGSIVLLSIGGKLLDTFRFTAFLEKHTPITFLIG